MGINELYGEYKFNFLRNCEEFSKVYHLLSLLAM